MENDSKSEYLFKINENKFNIYLLDTIENRDLFNNLENHYSNNDSKNIILKEEENSIQNKTELTTNNIENLNINSETNKINISNNDDNKSYESNNDDKNNCLSFKDFMAKVKNKKNENKTVSKSFTSKNIYKRDIEKRKNKNIENNKSETKDKKEEKIKNKKYSKERLELNKQRLNKLYNDYKNFKNKIENKKIELSKDELKDCSFSPKINKYSKILIRNNPNFSKPIFLRNNDKKDFYKKKYEINFTHIPKINKKYNNNLDIYSRLYNKNQIKNYNYENETDYPFRPITNYNYEKNHKNLVTFQNVLKREILLNEYINRQQIELNDNNKKNKLSFTPNTSCTSNSLFSIKKEKKKLIFPCFNKINKTIIKNNKVSRSLKNNNNNLKINNSYYQNEYNKPIIMNKSMKNSKSFILDYFNKTNIKKNKKQFELISIKNNLENEIQNYINKINIKNNKGTNEGICINIKKKCNNFKMIINKNRSRSIYK